MEISLIERNYEWLEGNIAPISSEYQIEKYL